MDEQTRHEILDLISKYSYGYDNADWELFASIWADVTTISGFGAATEPRDCSAIVELYRTRRELLASEGRQPRHYQTNTVLAELGDGRVQGCTMFFLVHQWSDQKAPTPMNSGKYHDEFVKTPAGWRIASRRVQGDQEFSRPVPTSR